MFTQKPNSQVLSDAKKVVLNSNSFTFYLTKLFISKNKLPYLFCWYAYFRWVDDIADSNRLTLENKIKFLSQQIELINSLYIDESHLKQLHTSESYLHELIKYDKRNGTLIKSFLIEMLHCIRFDVNRVNSYSSKFDLDSFFSKEVLSYLNTFNFFCSSPNLFLEIRYSFEGMSGKWVHVLRDFVKDIEDNIYNLPNEDIIAYNIDIHNLSLLPLSNNFKRWVSEKMKQIILDFREGKKELKRQKSLKYKMIVLVLCFKYQLYWDEIFKDGYNLKRNYKITTLKILRKSPILIYEILTFSIHHFLHKLNFQSKKLLQEKNG